MADIMLGEVEKYILSLNIDEKIKVYILDTFLKYSLVIKNFYCIAYQKAPDIANYYLKCKTEEFRKKLDLFLKSEDNSLEYITYILENPDLYDRKKLSPLDRKQIDRLESLYNRLMNGDFMNMFYEEILTHSSKNFDKINTELYTLARYMGYIDDADDYISLNPKDSYVMKNNGK